MTDTAQQSQWVALDMFTGEIRPLEDAPAPHKQRKPDAAFIALVKLGGLQGQLLTDSLRGAYNKARSQIVQCEQRRDPDISLDAIAELIDGFGAWFKQYRREMFNEVCRRAPFPMETAKLWPTYRKPDSSRDVAADWLHALGRDE